MLLYASLMIIARIFKLKVTIKGRALQTNLQKIENEPEESFDSAAVHTRNQVCPIWLGISRDIRIFEIGTPQEMNIITPRMASSSVTLPETNNSSVTIAIWQAGDRGLKTKGKEARRRGFTNTSYYSDG